MDVVNMLDLPLELLEKIWRYCSKASLKNLICCSSTCNQLVTPILYEKITVKWEQLEKNQVTLPLDNFKFTKKLAFRWGNWNMELRECENLSLKFRLVINSCSAMQLNNLSIENNPRDIPDHGYLDPCMDMVHVFSKFQNLQMIQLQNFHN